MQPDEYRKMAEVEDRMWYYQALHRHVEVALGRHLSPNARVLDAGCGTGGLLRHLAGARPEWQLSGIDFSPLAVELAQQRCAGDIRPGSVAQLPWAAGEFAAIASCDVLCQVTDPILVLREFVRCLRPDGIVILTMPAYQWMLSYHDRAVGNLRRYSRSEIHALLRAAGLTPVTSFYWNALLFPLALLRRKLLPPAASASDVRLYPAPLEAIFTGMMMLERGWLRLTGWLPGGLSILAVARRTQRT